MVLCVEWACGATFVECGGKALRDTALVSMQNRLIQSGAVIALARRDVMEISEPHWCRFNGFRWVAFLGVSSKPLKRFSSIGAKFSPPG
jgi:hypothetical protein